MKTIKAFLTRNYSIGDLCHERSCYTITFKESDIVFVSDIEIDSYYGSYTTYHRTICLNGYGLIEILSKKEEDLFIKDFDKEILDDK